MNGYDVVDTCSLQRFPRPIPSHSPEHQMYPKALQVSVALELDVNGKTTRGPSVGGQCLCHPHSI